MSDIIVAPDDGLILDESESDDENATLDEWGIIR